MKKQNDYKNDFSLLTEKSIDILEDFQDSLVSKSKNNTLNDSLLNISKTINKGISNIVLDIEYFEKNVDWDNFNIAFFGETNAGKSTLIESLINGDGVSIGDGRKDFTQTVEVKKNKAFKNINILDMPGIEGNESKYIEDIRKAVEKAHIIFYVIGTGKEIEEITLRKVKNYIKDQAKVYSILNIRNKPSAYRIKKELVDETSIKIQSRIEMKFREVLGEKYMGNLILNAHLAFLSNSTPKREDFIKDKNKMIEIFGSESKSLEFSHLSSLINKMNELSEYGNREIIISNTNKFLSSIENIISEILLEQEKFDSSILDLKKELSTVMNRSTLLVKKYHQEIVQCINIELNEMENGIKSVVIQGIENNHAQEKIKNNINHIRENYKLKIDKKTKLLLNDMNSEFRDLITQFKNRIELNIKISSWKNEKGDIDLVALMKKLEITMSYLMGQVLDLGTSILSVISLFALNPILGVITGVVMAVRKIWDWFFKDPQFRKNQAKNEACLKIENEISKVRITTISTLQKELKNLENQVNKSVSDINIYINNIENISTFITNKIDKINEKRIEISNLLVKNICPISSTDFSSFINLKLNKMIIIASNFEKTDDLKKLLLLKEIIIYRNINDFLKEGYFIKNVFYLNKKDDFLYESFKIFKKKLNITNIVQNR